MGNLLIAQSGGPTAAINATAAGIIAGAYASNKVGKIWGASNGIQGVLNEKFIDIRKQIKNAEDMELLCQTPAAAFGSCRLKLKSLKENRTEFERIIQVFRKYEIAYFIYIGGNDSMDTVDKLSAYCREENITDITIVGAPKTVDNDLAGTDHCPGFGSAAKYIGVTFAELERDCGVYDTKAVTIVEVMGRNAGWLTAASSLPRMNGHAGPDLIYLCETAFDIQKFLKAVEKKLESKNSVIVAVSEGIKDKEGRYISETVQSGIKDAFGHSYIAGSAKVLEEVVRNEIGCKVRSIELNLMQRCAGHLASAVDISESRMLGLRAFQSAIDQEGGVMAAVIRKSNEPYTVTYEAVPVSEVSNKEKTVPSSFVTEEGDDVTLEMLDYLKPLIQGEHRVVYENGIPKHIKF